MADIAFTVADIKKTADTRPLPIGYAGVAIVAGDMVHLESGLYVLSECDASALEPAKSKTLGMALNPAAVDQAVLVAKGGNVAVGAGVARSGTLTNASAVVTSLSTTTDLNVGHAVTGTGIPASTKILTVDSGTQVTLTNNATATGANTLTFAALRKGMIYILSGTPGKICPITDQAANDWITIVGIAETNAILRLLLDPTEVLLT